MTIRLKGEPGSTFSGLRMRCPFFDGVYKVGAYHLIMGLSLQKVGYKPQANPLTRPFIGAPYPHL